MTSALLRMLGQLIPKPVHTYKPHAAPLSAVPASAQPNDMPPDAAKAAGPKAKRRAAKTLTRAAETSEAGEEPVQETEAVKT
jgi:hypothetical protein